MAEFRVASVHDIPQGEGRVFETPTRMVAVFHVDEEFYAINDMCPHAGASLSEGWIDGNCVTCPWHAWQFRLDDGSYVSNPRTQVETYPLRREGDDLYVSVPDA